MRLRPMGCVRPRPTRGPSDLFKRGHFGHSNSRFSSPPRTGNRRREAMAERAEGRPVQESSRAFTLPSQAVCGAATRSTDRKSFVVWPYLQSAEEAGVSRCFRIGAAA